MSRGYRRRKKREIQNKQSIDNRNEETRTMITFTSLTTMLDKDSDYQNLKEEFKDIFDEIEIQKYLESELRLLEQTKSVSLHYNRSDFLVAIIGNLKTFLSSVEGDKKLVKAELEKFKFKVDSIVELTLEGKKKASVEMVLLEREYILESKYKNKPFYIAKDGKLKIAKKWAKDPEPISNLESPIEVAEELNYYYNEVLKLIELSTGDVRSQIGMLYDIVTNTDNLFVYELELKEQPWYKEMVARHSKEGKKR